MGGGGRDGFHGETIPPPVFRRTFLVVAFSKSSGQSTFAMLFPSNDGERPAAPHRRGGASFVALIGSTKGSMVAGRRRRGVERDIIDQLLDRITTRVVEPVERHRRHRPDKSDCVSSWSRSGRFDGSDGKWDGPGGPEVGVRSSEALQPLDHADLELARKRSHPRAHPHRLDQHNAGHLPVPHRGTDPAVDRGPDRVIGLEVADERLTIGAEPLDHLLVKVDKELFFRGVEIIGTIGSDTGLLAERLDGRAGVARRPKKLESGLQDETTALRCPPFGITPEHTTGPSGRRLG